MQSHAENLKAVMEYFSISNKELAQALAVDPSYVSRWVAGKRRLIAASAQMDALAEYILSRSKRVSDMAWLKAKFAADGLPTDVATVYRFKQNLIMWLASDGETLRHNLGRALPGDLAGTAAPELPKQAVEATQAESDVKLGNLPIVFALDAVLDALPEGASVNIFLSSDRIVTAADADFAALLLKASADKKLMVNMVICVSGDTQAIHKLLDSYLTGLIAGQIKLSAVHGITQAITGTMHVMTGDTCMLVNETLGAAAPPVGVMIRDAAFVREAKSNFTSAARYAQPVMRIYGDAYTRDVIEILAMEYCTPSGLDVVKDSINPMFMSCEAFDRFLGTRGHSPEEYAWRSAEFARFKAGMNANLQSGVPFREIISLARLHDIAQRGSCRMAGLYFAELGYVDLDREGCIDILTGYIDYLTNEPNFSLLILDTLPELHGNNCWHIKRDGHISINNWQGKEPVMIYSDQLMLLREFQARYDALWERGAGAIGSRASVISILKDVAGRMKEKSKNKKEIIMAKSLFSIGGLYLTSGAAEASNGAWGVSSAKKELAELGP